MPCPDRPRPTDRQTKTLRRTEAERIIIIMAFDYGPTVVNGRKSSGRKEGRREGRKEKEEKLRFLIELEKMGRKVGVEVGRG